VGRRQEKLLSIAYVMLNTHAPRLTPHDRPSGRKRENEMQLAIVERLDDLVAAAERLKDLIRAECSANPLPAMALCRAAVDVDQAVSAIEQHVERLSIAAPMAKPVGTPAKMRFRG
jgi:hypothetical protein